LGTGSSRDQRVELFWAIVQKVLDIASVLYYNRRFLQDQNKLKKFGPHPQKRLDILRSRTYNGAGTTKNKSSSHYYWRARAKFVKRPLGRLVLAEGR